MENVSRLTGKEFLLQSLIAFYEILLRRRSKIPIKSNEDVIVKSYFPDHSLLYKIVLRYDVHVYRDFF